MSHDKFLYLLDDVEELGGTHLPERCVGQVLYKSSGSPTTTHGCRKEYRLLMPYLREDGEEADLAVCAEGDRVDLWPRLQALDAQDSA